MRTLKFLVQKEFLQIFRNKAMLPLIFVLPIIQMVILTYAADFELKNITYVFVDGDHSQASERLLGQFNASPYFRLKGEVRDFKSGMEALDKSEATLFLRIPPKFEG